MSKTAVGVGVPDDPGSLRQHTLLRRGGVTPPYILP